MKNIFVMVLFFTMGITICYAQVEQNPQPKLNTIFDSENFDALKFSSGKNVYSVYGYPIIGMTSILDKDNKEFGLTIGGGANLLINRKFYIGVFGEYIKGIDLINGSSFGGVIGYIHGIENVLNFDFSMRIGGSYFETPDIMLSNQNLQIRALKFKSNGFVLNPRVGTNYNISQFLILNIALGYRFHLRTSSHQVFKNLNFSGPSFSLQFNFGSF